jgi:hypothetical protein
MGSDGRRRWKRKRNMKGKQIWCMKGQRETEWSRRKEYEKDMRQRKKREEQGNRKN